MCASSIVWHCYLFLCIVLLPYEDFHCSRGECLGFNLFTAKVRIVRQHCTTRLLKCVFCHGTHICPPGLSTSGRELWADHWAWEVFALRKTDHILKQSLLMDVITCSSFIYWCMHLEAVQTFWKRISSCSYQVACWHKQTKESTMISVVSMMLIGGGILIGAAFYNVKAMFRIGNVDATFYVNNNCTISYCTDSDGGAVTMSWTKKWMQVKIRAEAPARRHERTHVYRSEVFFLN